MKDEIVIRKSVDGRITAWSDGAARAFGYSAEEVLGRHVSLIIPFDYQDQEYDMLDRLRAGENLGVIKTVRRAKNGQLFQASVEIVPIRDDDGKIVGAEKRYRDLVPIEP